MEEHTVELLGEVWEDLCKVAGNNHSEMRAFLSLDQGTGHSIRKAPSLPWMGHQKEVIGAEVSGGEICII